ncbi:copper homeostasis protein CutC [Streptomyces xiamenensis]|uniref:copper homeostasis protein CutC n=1 Tax=Streptomyces xiamenensis TaxID=408015 RepID=UPI0036A8A09B
MSVTRPLLEVIALTAQDARAAWEGGADRIELVTGMEYDGLTPDAATVTAVLAATALPVRVMLRSGAGFGAAGTERLGEAAGTLRAAGAREFVLGFLDGGGAVDLTAVRALTRELGGAPWTFHRALDHSADRLAARAALRGLPGLDTVLTAGAAGGVTDGLPVLCAEAAAAGGGPRLMAGGGLRLGHLPALRAAGVDAFHIGGAAREGGSWAAPVSAAAVRTWRRALDEAADGAGAANAANASGTNGANAAMYGR